MKRFMILLILIIFILTSCSNINSADKMEGIYKNEIAKEIDLKEDVEAISIIATQSIGENVNLVVYSYYSNLNKRDEIGLKYALWDNYNVDLTDLTVPKNDTNIPVTFSNIIHEPDGNTSLIGNLYNTEYYMISYGAVYDDKIDSIKLVYGDGSAIIRPVIKNGYIIYRFNNISGVTNIEALDKDGNVIYQEII